MGDSNGPAVAERIRDLAGLPELATRAELAGFMGVSVATLSRWAVEKTGPRVTKLGHAARYRKADVIRYLDEVSA